jgi:hypothetical protein
MALSKRFKTLAGAALVADGVSFLVNPTAQLEIWSSPRAPRWYQHTLRYFRAHKGVCRALAGLELAAGTMVIARTRA